MPISIIGQCHKLSAALAGSGGDKMRDLMIGAKELSDSTLIKIAANGLSS
jgi:hypothetical protein